jgi:hypothetical protein
MKRRRGGGGSEGWVQPTAAQLELEDLKLHLRPFPHLRVVDVLTQDWLEVLDRFAVLGFGVDKPPSAPGLVGGRAHIDREHGHEWRRLDPFPEVFRALGVGHDTVQPGAARCCTVGVVGRIGNPVQVPGATAFGLWHRGFPGDGAWLYSSAALCRLGSQSGVRLGSNLSHWERPQSELFSSFLIF